MISKQGLAKQSINSMSETIINALKSIAEVHLPAEDHERFKLSMQELQKRLAMGNMYQEVGASHEQIIKCNGSDFIFEKSLPLIAAGTIAYFQLGEMTPPIPAYVHARHEYSGHWKYDLIIAVRVPDGWHLTRIYNVESKWLTQI